MQTFPDSMPMTKKTMIAACRSASRPSKTKWRSGRSSWCWRPCTNRTSVPAHTDEVQLEARVLSEPGLHLRGLVGLVVVADRVHGEVLCYGPVDLFQEADELLGAVTRQALADDLASLDIECRKHRPWTFPAGVANVSLEIWHEPDCTSSPWPFLRCPFVDIGSTPIPTTYRKMSRLSVGFPSV
jgi:hypothetical protein